MIVGSDSIALKVINLVARDVTLSDINVSHRPKKNQAPGKATNTRFPPSIIVRFTSRRVRDSVYKQRKKLSQFKTSDIGYEAKNNMYINENLTPRRRSLFTKVNTRRKEWRWRYLFSTNAGRWYWLNKPCKLCYLYPKCVDRLWFTTSMINDLAHRYANYQWL